MPDLDLSLNELAARNKAIWQMDAAGLSPAQRAMPALVHRNAYAPAADQTRVLLVGGLSGRQADVYLVLDALRNYLAGGDGLARSVALSAVPCGNPDGRETGGVPRNSAGGNPASGYPPQDNFFFDKQNPEARYLWRWIGFQAPDLLLEVRAGDQVAWEATPGATSVIPNSRPMAVDDSLLAALSAGKPNGVGTVPGLRLTAPRHALTAELARLWQSLARASKLPLSPARRTLDTRRRRTPLEIARLLSSVYGHKLDPVTYTQGVSVSGRLRLAKLDPQDRATVPDVVKLVEPYASGAREVFTGRVAPGSFNGLAWAQELTQATGDRRYADMLVSAANRYQAGASGGAPPPSDPDFRTEDMFMNGSILGRAFSITREGRYLDLLTGFLLDAPVQQPNGLFWHSRATPFYWGRGNGFAALGFAETLTHLPGNHPRRAALLAKHLKHLEALRPHQRPSGMLSQVVDLPGSYQELTATCMAGYAAARGMRLGWLDQSWRPWVDLAWQGVSERVDESGGIVDACTNTGVQKSLQEYLDRAAVFGLDDRGGAMALWFATEMEQLRRGTPAG